MLDVVVTSVTRRCQAQFKRLKSLPCESEQRLCGLMEETRGCKGDSLMEVRQVLGF